MPKWLFLALATSALQAAVIRGVVVEHQTGRPLARTLVVAQPVAGTAGVPASVRTDVNGAFTFPPLAAGAYLVSATRRSFAPLQYGQKRWKAAGVPIVLAESGSAALTLRMQRFGSIAGTVVDENEVGLPEHEVLAYRNTRPLQLVAHATTDDRGMYRLWGLEPGSYLVRTAPKKAGEDSYLPTFAREVVRVDEARPVEVEIDRQTEQVSVRPFPGRLYTVAGQAHTSPQVPVRVTLVSDVGSQSLMADPSGTFRFDSVPPGAYEVYALAQADRRAGGGTLAAFTPLMVERDYNEARLRMGGMADVEVVVEDTKGQPVDFALFQILRRRKDLSGDGPPEPLKLQQGRATLVPGRWDLELLTTAGFYVARFIGPQGDRGQADGWNEMTVLSGPASVKFVLSPNPGVVRGVVTGANGATVAGAPVFLESYDPETRRRLVDLRLTRTDLQGQYEFYGLPPRSYRIISTFEYQSPDMQAMDAMKARTVKVEESRDTVVDLGLYVMP